MNKLYKKSFRGLLIVLVVMGMLIFLPAGTFVYWQAWVLLTVFTLSSIILTIYLMKNDPKLLERRLSAGPRAEKEMSQKIIMSITSTGFIALLVVSGLDHRYAWSKMPFYVAIAGDIFIAIGMLIIFFVYKENTFASAIIELSPEHKVISTGLYSHVRHPMYMGGIFYLGGIPIALGSWWGLLVIVLMLPALIWRLLDEEKFLAKNLPGYKDYQNKVKYHLVPFIW